MLSFGMFTLVLRQFDINESASDGPPIEIAGRASGFVSWLLTVMKLSTLTALRLESDRVSVVAAGLCTACGSYLRCSEYRWMFRWQVPLTDLSIIDLFGWCELK